LASFASCSSWDNCFFIDFLDDDLLLVTDRLSIARRLASRSFRLDSRSSSLELEREDEADAHSGTSAISGDVTSSDGDAFDLLKNLTIVLSQCNASNVLVSVSATLALQCGEVS